MDKVTIFCPGISTTGGPESLHNLSFNLRKHGLDCKIATTISSMRFKEYFSVYEPEYIQIDDSFINESFVLLPEVYTHYLSKFKSQKRAVWWLSFINHRNSLKIKYKIRNYGLKSITTKDALKRKINILNVYHFMQTNSSKNYLFTNYKFDKNKILDLESPLHPSYYNLNKKLNLEEENSVVLNSSKLSSESISFIKEFFEGNQYKVYILKNKTRQEVKEILDKSKFFLDLGPHPGQERLPRESILMGCLPIVSLKGTASNFKDFPLPYHSKINISSKLKIENLIKAHHIMEEINRGKDYGHNDYKDHVESQPKRFLLQLKKIISLIKSF